MRVSSMGKEHRQMRMVRTSVSFCDCDACQCMPVCSRVDLRESRIKLHGDLSPEQEARTRQTSEQ
jgi:hypothetical protein